MQTYHFVKQKTQMDNVSGYLQHEAASGRRQTWEDGEIKKSYKRMSIVIEKRVSFPKRNTFWQI